ncbi:hypothetical protein QMK33_09520 [Hymenobacter sp. H14-R3]|uniref:DUF6714 family protein n=1 Tax=Hymenobacter sp. H14-R3 TaxID=3046308 RepID=UPI0024BAC54D|nr:DUF6714 family protein [Hymenobacter sp. H14-R3]MDJ0365392.1 hypothetical protein [Hymenobacter sp. H14-R3]
MTANALLAELTESFQHELFPGDKHIVANNEPGYDFESLQIRDSFKEYTWQTLPAALMRYEQDSFFLLSPAGFKYYLPAYLCYAVRAYTEATSIPDSLIFALTLPAEVAEVLAAHPGTPPQLGEGVPEIKWENYPAALQRQAHYHLSRYQQFNATQGRALYHFLAYMRAEHGSEYWRDEPEIAIARYWGRFA